MVSGESVERACSEVGHYTDEQMVDEFDRFFRAQPAVCDFVVELTQESGQKVQELSLFLSYMVFKTIEVADIGGVELVTSEVLETAYRQTETWMADIGETEGAAMEQAVVRSLQQDTQPHILQYVISELNEPMEDGAELNDEEKGEVFFLLKTVISSMCRS